MSNHSFDIHIAEEYKSVEIAILVWHFQYWILRNKRLKRNLHDDRTWSYQTITEIAAVFPYWSVKQVERLIAKALKLKIIKKGNFNRSKYDRTSWYAFENEEKFSISRNREMEEPESGNGKDDIGTPIPDTIPDPLTDKTLAPSQATAFACSFFQRLKKINPKQKKPNLAQWAKEIDQMIRLDERSYEDAERILEWAQSQEDDYWPTVFQSPRTLRKLFDRALIKMAHKSKAQKVVSEEEIKLSKVEHSKTWAMFLKAVEWPEQERYMNVKTNSIEIRSGRERMEIGYAEPQFQQIILNKLKSWGIKV